MATPLTVTAAFSQGTNYNGSGATRRFIQNLGTSPLFVKYGAGCSATDFNLVLSAGAASNDGTGGSTTWNDYFGPVSVFSVGTLNYQAWELNGA